MKNIKVMIIALLAFVIPFSANFNADELVTRDTIPNAEEYKQKESKFNEEDYSEKINELYNKTQADLNATKKTKSDVVNSGNILDLLEVANATLTKEECSNIAADFTCKYVANFDGKGNNELTFKYAANDDFKVITNTNKSNKLTYVSRFAYGEQKYEIYYDPSTGEIIKTVTYVYGTPQLTTTFENGEAVMFEYQFFVDGYLSEHAIVNEYGYLLYLAYYYYGSDQVEVEIGFDFYVDEMGDFYNDITYLNSYYPNGNYQSQEIYEEGFLVQILEYNSKGILTADIEYTMWGDVLSAKKYYENGILKTHEKFDEEQNPIMSKAYSQTGKIQNYYTYYSNRQVKTETLYDSRGEQAYKRDNYSTGRRKMIAKYDSGVATVRNYYNKFGKRTSQKQYVNGKVSKLFSYDSNGKVEVRRVFKSNGKLVSKTYYSNNKKTQIKQYHTNGKTKSVIKYDSKERKTTLVTYDTKGQRTSFVEYNKDGTIKKLITYKNGKIVGVKIY